MLDCTWPNCQELLPAAIAGTLAPAEQARVTEHLATCAVCRRMAAEWQQVATLARQADVAATRFAHAGASATWAAIQASLVAESPFEGEALHMDTNDSTTTGQQTSSSRTMAGTDGRRRRTGASVVAFGAVVALIALAATLFALHGRPAPATPSTHGSSTTRSTSVTTSATATATPQPTFNVDSSFGSIVSATAAWDVEIGTQDGQTFPSTSEITHFDGNSWQTSLYMEHTFIQGISMDSATDGWVVGNYAIPTGGFPQDGKVLLLHYTGGHWTKVQASNFPAFSSPQSVQMFSADDGWMVDWTPQGYTFFRFTAGQWQNVPFAPQNYASALTVMQQPASPHDNPNPNIPQINRLQMFSDTEGWGQGLWHNAEVIWRDHNGTWTAELPQSITSGGLGYSSLAANSANDVWILAAEGVPPSHAATSLSEPYSSYTQPRSLGNGSYELLHFDGSQWQTVQLPNNVATAPLDGFAGDANWLSVSALLNNGNPPLAGLYHRSGSQWALTTLPGTYQQIASLVDEPDGTALAIAEQASSPNAPSLLRYANGAWTLIG
jgi:hypothetical protein